MKVSEVPHLKCVFFNKMIVRAVLISQKNWTKSTKFLHNPGFHTCNTSPTSNSTHHVVNLVQTTNLHEQTHHYHSKSIVYNRVLHILEGFNKWVTVHYCTIQKFYCPRCSAYSPLPCSYFRTTTHLFTASLVLLALSRTSNSWNHKICRCSFSFCLLSLCNTHFRFFWVFS